MALQNALESAAPESGVRPERLLSGFHSPADGMLRLPARFGTLGQPAGKVPQKGRLWPYAAALRSHGMAPTPIWLSRVGRV